MKGRLLKNGIFDRFKISKSFLQWKPTIKLQFDLIWGTDESLRVSDLYSQINFLTGDFIPVFDCGQNRVLINDFIAKENRFSNTRSQIRPSATTEAAAIIGSTIFALLSLSLSVQPIDKAAVDFDRADLEGYQRLMD